MKILPLLILLALIPANADDASQEQLEINAYQAYRAGKKEFNAERMGIRVQKSLNTAVKFGAHHLQRRGNAYGKTALKEWETRYSKVFLAAEIGMSDIGDHEAIAWLLNFYTKLEKTLGKDTMMSTHLFDIWVFAHAIPVVFNPSRQDIDRPEYKLHFVPFSKAVGYWTVLGGCTIYNWIGTPVTTLICSPIAEAGRLAFGLIGDPLSDAIWNAAR